MKNIALMSSVAVLSLGLMMSAACSDDETTGTGGTGNVGNTGGNTGGSGGSTGGSGGTGGTGGGGDVEVPTLGDQIDRKGRPAINTATINTFDLVAGDPNQARADAEAEYNANDDPTSWASDYANTIASALAIYDSLADGDTPADGACGDQTFYNAGLTDGGTGADGYMTLATVLANDWLVIDSTQAPATCGYLGVETTLLGGDASCGGRMPGEDVMDATYGVLAPAAGFGDEIDAPAATPLTEFPWLAAADANVEP